MEKPATAPVADYFSNMLENNGLSWLDRWEEEMAHDLPGALAELKLSGRIEEVAKHAYIAMFNLHRAAMFAQDAVAPSSELAPYGGGDKTAATIRREVVSDCLDALEAVWMHLVSLFSCLCDPVRAREISNKLLVRRIEQLMEDYGGEALGGTLKIALVNFKKEFEA